MEVVWFTYAVTCCSDNHIGYCVPVKSHNDMYSFRFRSICDILVAVTALQNNKELDRQ